MLLLLLGKLGQVLCVIQRKVVHLLCFQDRCFFPILLLSDFNMIYLVIELISLFKEINNWT